MAGRSRSRLHRPPGALAGERLLRTCKPVRRGEASSARGLSSPGQALSRGGPRVRTHRKDPSLESGGAHTPKAARDGLVVHPGGSRRTGALRHVESARVCLPSQHQSFLEANAVLPSTLASYRTSLREFYLDADLSAAAVDEEDPAGLEIKILGYLDECYRAGLGPDTGQRLLAALRFLHPRLHRDGGYPLPRVQRALKGWLRLEPPLSRWPLPWPIAAAMIVQSVMRNEWSVAMAVLIGFVAYLRPSELTSLKVKHLLPPLLAKEGGGAWALLVRSMEDRIPTKTNTFDHSVLLDRPDLLWLGPFYQAMVQDREPNARIFGISQDYLATRIKELGEAASGRALTITAYSLRHGGASWDYLMQHRDINDIMKRGNWRQRNSVRRYEKAAKTIEALQKVPPVLRDAAADAAAQFRLWLSEPEAATQRFGTSWGPSSSSLPVKPASRGRSAREA